MMIKCDVIYRCILLGLSFGLSLGLILGHVILRPRLQIFSLVLRFSSDVEISADPSKNVRFDTVRLADEISHRTTT